MGLRPDHAGGAYDVPPDRLGSHHPMDNREAKFENGWAVADVRIYIAHACAA